MSKGANKHEIQIVPVAKLKPHPKNSRAHSSKQVNELRASIREFGVVKPVVIDERNVILAGHGLHEAAKAEGLSEIPAIRVSGLTAKQKRAYLIADNRLAEKSSWDWDLLAAELTELHGLTGLEALGFSEWNPVSKALDNPKKTGEITEHDLKTDQTCPACGFEF